MSTSGKGSQARVVWQSLLVAAVLLLVARTVQLALRKPAEPDVHVSTMSAPADDGAQMAFVAVADASYAPHAELARLYIACPASATVNWDQVVECAQRGQLDTALARVIETKPAAGWSRRQSRQVPRVAYETPVRVASTVGRATTNSGITSVDNDGWLVDPHDWYSEEDRRLLEVQRRDDIRTQPPVSPEPTPAEQQPAVGTKPAEVTPADIQPTDESGPRAETTTEPKGPLFAPPESGAAVDSPTDAGSNERTTGRPSPELNRQLEEQSTGESTAPPPDDRLFTPPEQLPAPTSPTPFTAPALPGTDTSSPQSVSPSPVAESLFAPPAEPVAPRSARTPAEQDPHLEVFAKNNYPSARACAKCHEQIYDEWSNSSHAYAIVSPMFQKFEQKITELSQGTVGYFCYRCHSPVGTTMCIDRTTPLWELPEVAREGVTCIACHRVQYRYGKSNGERRIEPGSIFAPVFGGIGGGGVAETIHRKDQFKVKTSPNEKGPGQDIHVAGIYFDQLSKSEFCASCHQVAVHPGIKLEVVWEQYRASPACKKGIRCQDCHMGRVPGVPSGFPFGAAAVVAGKTVSENRKHSNHVFYGPGYSIAHPGVFPFHQKADRWTIEQWLQFDWRAGWGTDEFEDAVDNGQIRVHFPPIWQEADDRYDAREIIEDNLKKLAEKREIRTRVMENGSHVDGPIFTTQPSVGNDLRFHYMVTNTNEGHNLLTASLGAQPQFWANVVLIGPDGRRLWETGYTDSYGDVADIHSVDVRQGRMPFDWQLFNLQTMFLITGVKGTDREFYLPVNVDIDQLPFLRPGVQPITTINHPPFIRMESRSLSPLGARKVPYRVPGDLLRQPGVYRLSFRIRSRAEPIYFMRFVGATIDMQRAMNERMIDVHPYSVEFVVK